MTTPHDHHDDADGTDLAELDAVARAAAAGLRAQVLQRLDAEAAIGFLPARTSRSARRPRLLAVAAAVAVLAATVTLIDQGDDDTARVEVEGEEALPSIEPGTLRPLGPRDGKDSIRLPLTVEPAAGLVDGQEVAVSGSGFQPGESVGIVQCAKEAAGQSPEVRAGVEACYISQYTPVTADDAGVASGTYKVRRLLTTPLSGTIDCAAEADRCMIAMGALADYDRSGVHPIEFDLNVEPVALPTVTAAPTEGLADGDAVHVVAEGLTPGEVLSVSVCSTDPMVCWATGSEHERTQREGDDVWTEQVIGLQVDGSGRVEADVPVWQFLPGDEPGTYVDCAVSRCSLRFSGTTAPPTVPLRFVPGTPPEPPAVAVEPSTDVAPGDVVQVRGTGFAPDIPIYVSLCGGTEAIETCTSSLNEELWTDGAGAFSVDFEIPVLTVGRDVDEAGCVDCTTSWTADPPETEELRCDGVESSCWITVDASYGMGRPTFGPEPVPVRFR